MCRPSPAILLAIALSSCGGATPASGLAKPPEFNPEGQTRCKVKKSQEKPLIVEWPTADRAELEATARSGTVVVSYNGCEMRVLSRCKAPGKYAYVPVTPKTDSVSIKTADELYANIPIYAARFETKLEQAGQLHVNMTMVGRFTADQGDVKQEQLTGSCQGATHIITGLSVGAFEFFAGADAEVGGGVGVMGVGAGARSTAKKETLTKDGDVPACGKATTTDGRPPEGCGALLRVEVARVAGVPVSLGAKVDLSGRWETDFQDGAGQPVHTIVVFAQSGASVLGTYATDAFYRGTLVGHELQATWTNGPGTGRADFAFAEDGRSFSGRWGVGEEAPSRPQVGRRIGEVQLSEPAPFDLSGAWKLELVDEGRAVSMHLVQEGASVTCSFDEGGVCLGRLSGTELRDVWTFGGRAGTAVMRFSADGRSFEGLAGVGPEAPHLKRRGTRR